MRRTTPTTALGARLARVAQDVEQLQRASRSQAGPATPSDDPFDPPFMHAYTRAAGVLSSLSREISFVREELAKLTAPPPEEEPEEPYE